MAKFCQKLDSYDKTFYEMISCEKTILCLIHRSNIGSCFHRHSTSHCQASTEALYKSNIKIIHDKVK